MIVGAKCILGCASRTLLEVTWGQGRRDKSLNGGYYAGASVFKEAFCAGGECQAT